MPLICALIGHQPTPFAAHRRAGRWRNRCLLCRQPIERTAHTPWEQAEELAKD